MICWRFDVRRAKSMFHHLARRSRSLQILRSDSERNIKQLSLEDRYLSVSAAV